VPVWVFALPEPPGVTSVSSRATTAASVAAKEPEMLVSLFSVSVFGDDACFPDRGPWPNATTESRVQCVDPELAWVGRGVHRVYDLFASTRKPPRVSITTLPTHRATHGEGFVREPRGFQSLRVAIDLLEAYAGRDVSHRATASLVETMVLPNTRTRGLETHEHHCRPHACVSTNER
jgi:hypothetical protein